MLFYFSLIFLFLVAGRAEAACRSVKARVISVEIPGIKLILYRPECFTETLKMHNLTGAEETDGICHVRFLHKPENIIIGAPRFLLGCQIFMKICDGISLRLKFTGIERNTASRLRPDAYGMIHIIRSKSGFLDFLR